MTITIASEQPDHIDAIRALNDAAFGRSEESRLVDALRDDNGLTPSLVALNDDQIVGHIAFSPGVINTNSGTVLAISLSCMAVLPDYQNRGVGSLMVCEGIERLSL